MKVLKVILTVVIALTIILYTTVADAAGWEVDKQEGTHLLSIRNVGDQGGFLKLSCNVETKKLSLQYMFDHKVYDFFIIRKFGDVDGNSVNGKIAVGMGTTTQAQVFHDLVVNRGAIAVIRMPVGTKAIWDKAIADNNPIPPAIEQEGEEFFLMGNDISKLMNKLGSSCPFNAEDKEPIF